MASARQRPVATRARAPGGVERPARRGSRSGSSTGAATALGVLFVVSFVALLGLLYMIFVGVGPEAVVQQPDDSRDLVIPNDAIRFNSLADFEAASLQSGMPFAMTISEAEINTRLASAVADLTDRPFSEVTARVGVDRIDFSGGMQVSGVAISPQVGLHFSARNGRLTYELLSLDVGPVPVPSFVRDQIAGLIDRNLQSQPIADRFVIEGLRERPGAVTVVGRLK